MSRIISYGADGRAHIGRGVKALADAVRVTLGPGGRNVLFNSMALGGPQSTKDGVTVAQEVFLDDPLEQMGAHMVKVIARKTVEDAGDGTTTATVLADAIFQAGVKLIDAAENRVNPVELKRGIDYAAELITGKVDGEGNWLGGGYLADISVPISLDPESPISACAVATIAANGDAKIGRLVADAVTRVGKEGAISITDSKTTETVVNTTDGLEFPSGYVSPYFINADKRRCVLEDAMVVVLGRRLGNLEDAAFILRAALDYSKWAERPFSLLVIADDVDSDPIKAFIANVMQHQYKLCIVKSPFWGEPRTEMLHDIAALVGCEVLDASSAVKLKELETARDKKNRPYLCERYFGAAGKVVVYPDGRTVITDGASFPEKFDRRLAEIRSTVETATDPATVDRAKRRLAQMTGGVATIRVGGLSEPAVKELQARVDDALHAARCAVSEGVVPGGGAALLHAQMQLRGQLGQGRTPSFALGFDLLRSVLSVPAREILTNAGLEADPIIADVLSNGNPYGHDASRNALGDMLAFGVVDPVKVVRMALVNAASVAGLLLTTECVIGDQVPAVVNRQMSGTIPKSGR